MGKARRKSPKKYCPTGTVTEGKLEFEVTLRFNIRSASWAGNDGAMFSSVWLMIKKHILGLIKFALQDDEDVQVKMTRWRRPGETWQEWKDTTWGWPLNDADVNRNASYLYKDGELYIKREGIR